MAKRMQRSTLTETSTTLATLPGKGLVRSCHSGCVHVTYGCVTLDFCRPEGFDRLVDLVRRHAPGGGAAEIQYNHVSLRFSREQFEEFAGMVAVASQHLEQLCVVRRMLAGFPEA